VVRPSVPVASTFIRCLGREPRPECRNRTGDEQTHQSIPRCRIGGHEMRLPFRQSEAPGRWQWRALCSAGRDLWLRNIRPELTGSNLRWSSARGTDTYVRCGRAQGSVISSQYQTRASLF